MKKLVTLIAVFLLGSITLFAQGFSGGFKAGLNFNTFEGETEMSFETLNRTTGFHVGATFAYSFTDLLGVKADLMYSQKGAQQNYEGPSFFYLYGDGTEQAIGGQRRSELDIVNSYIDIPVLAYYRIGPLELAAGASAGLLINSIASGGATYTETVYGDNVDIIFNYEGNFVSDGFGSDAIASRSEEPVSGTNVRLPDVIGPYYNSNTDENLFRRLDFGLVAEASFYFNSGLYIGGRYNLGLTDVTREENDLAGQLSSSEERQFRDDDDRNRSLQISIGFRF